MGGFARRVKQSDGSQHQAAKDDDQHQIDKVELGAVSFHDVESGAFGSGKAAGASHWDENRTPETRKQVFKRFD
jgi:hypothetical protein